MSLQGKEDEEVKAVRLAAMLPAPKEEDEEEVLIQNASTTKKEVKEVNVKSLEEEEDMYPNTKKRSNEGYGHNSVL